MADHFIKYHMYFLFKLVRDMYIYKKKIVSSAVEKVLYFINMVYGKKYMD